MSRPAFFLAASLIGVAPAWADCDHFKWSLAREALAFAATEPLAATGGRAAVGKGYAVKLTQGLALPNKPGRDPGPATFAAVIDLPSLDAGLYQIALSQEAWIDVAQNASPVKSSDFSGQHDCPGLRKSVRFALGAGSATVEVSDASAQDLNFVIFPAP